MTGTGTLRKTVDKRIGFPAEKEFADQKKAMLELYRAGILPMLQVHDELDVAVESEEQGKRIVEIMEHCVELAVPSIVDAEFGPTWGDAKTTFSDRPWTKGLSGGNAPQSTAGEK